MCYGSIKICELWTFSWSFGRVFYITVVETMELIGGFDSLHPRGIQCHNISGSCQKSHCRIYHMSTSRPACYGVKFPSSDQLLTGWILKEIVYVKRVQNHEQGIPNTVQFRNNAAQYNTIFDTALIDWSRIYTRVSNHKLHPIPRPIYFA